MLASVALRKFLDAVPSEYPNHMFCSFADAARKGIILAFSNGLVRVVAYIDTECPGYADEVFGRIGAIKGTGRAQYEALIQILSEIYVTAGVLRVADRHDGHALFAHEPGRKGEKNPECEVSIAGHWCAIEVKAPALMAHAEKRRSQPWQLAGRVPQGVFPPTSVKPRDNPVKDFLVSAEAKFAAYEAHRTGALRLLFIIWDDFCNEPITALLSPGSGLLTPESFHRGQEYIPGEVIMWLGDKDE